MSKRERKRGRLSNCSKFNLPSTEYSGTFCWSFRPGTVFSITHNLSCYSENYKRYHRTQKEPSSKWIGADRDSDKIQYWLVMLRSFSLDVKVNSAGQIKT